jgi:hypothetical protein
VTRAERRRVAVDAALDEAVKTLEQTNLRAVLVMRDLCGQLSEAEGEADE